MAFKKLKLWFDENLLIQLAEKIEEHISTLDRKEFITKTNEQLDSLELKDRVRVIGQAIYNQIPGEYPEKVKVLHKILGPENNDGLGHFSNFFWVWTISSVVEQYGLDYRKESLDLIYEITKRSTGEFAIRQFLEEDAKATMKTMNKWSKDKNFHVRRLSSEGLRPRLPWAKKLDLFVEDPTPTIEILDRLKNDSSRYVLTSVANHLGDLLKLNYDFTLPIILDWSKSATENTKWIIRHAIRYQRKKGNAFIIDLTSKMK